MESRTCRVGLLAVAITGFGAGCGPASTSSTSDLTHSVRQIERSVGQVLDSRDPEPTLTWQVDIEPADAAGSPTIGISGSIRAGESCDVEAGAPGQFVDEERLTASVNEGSAVLLPFGCRDGALTAFSIGWVDGDQMFTASETEPDLVEFDYEGYILEGAVREGLDDVVVTLEANHAYTVRLDEVVVGRDVAPGSTTTLDVFDAAIERSEDGTTLTLDYELRSDRATAASMIVDVSENTPLAQHGAKSVDLTDGVAAGTLSVTLPGRPERVEGVLVAETDGFNGPSVFFEASTDGARSWVENEIVLLAGFVLAAISLGLLWPARAEGGVTRHRVVAVALLAALPLSAGYRIVIDDTLSDSGGAVWVVGIYLAFFVWEVVSFLPALRSVGRSRDRRAGVVLVAFVLATIGSFVILSRASDGGALVALGLMPAFGLGAHLTARAVANRWSSSTVAGDPSTSDVD